MTDADRTSAPPPTPTRAAPAARRVWSQARFELRLLARNGESLLVTLGIPLGVLVVAGGLDLAPTNDGGDDPLVLLVPGVLAIAVMSAGFVAQAIQTGFQRKYGVLKRLGSTPLTRLDFVVAKVVAVSAVVAVQAVLLLVTAVLVGWDVPRDASAGLLVLGLVLGTGVFTALGLLLAGALKAELTLALSNAVYLVLAVLAGAAAFDTSTLPMAVRQVAAFSPGGALAIVLQDALPPVGDDVSLWPMMVLVLLGWLVLAVVAAVRTFRWE